MKHSKQYIILGMIFLIFPISMVSAANGSGASIIMITSLNTTNTDNPMAMSGDGSMIIAGTHSLTTDDNITLYQVPDSFTGKSAIKWTIDKNWIEEVDISSNGSKIISCDVDTDTISCYSNEGITPLWELNSAYQLMDAIISENGNYVAYIEYNGSENNVYLVSGSDKSMIWNNPTTANNINFDVNNNGKILFPDSFTSLKFFDATGYKWTAENINYPQQSAISEDGDFMIVNSYNLSNDVIHALNGDGVSIWNYTGEFASKGTALAKTTKDIVVCTYNAIAEKILFFKFGSSTPDWEISTDAPNKYASISNDGSIAAIADYENHLKIIDTENGVVLTDHAIGSSIKSVEVTENGEKVAIMTSDKSIIVYDVNLEPENGFLDNFLNTFTNLDNLFGLLATAGLFFIIGAVVFGTHKRKK